MVNLQNKKIFKLICIALVSIILFSTIMPITSYADNDDSDSLAGGKLFKPVSKLVCGISDGVIILLQKYFLGYGVITDNMELGDVEAGEYKIYYGPAAIFSNNIPALNANFISPNTGMYQFHDVRTTGSESIKTSHSSAYMVPSDLGVDVENVEDYWKEQKRAGMQAADAFRHGFDLSTARQVDAARWISADIYAGLSGDSGGAIAWMWEYEGVTYVLTQITRAVNVGSRGAYWGYDYELFRVEIGEVEGTTQIEYSANKLQPIIATWYKGLRLISLVGLLSVLVYVGIRIIISSTGQEKAKYKKMIGDWLAAICILFVLQYIMAFTITITTELLNIFPDAQAVDGADALMSSMRTKVAEGRGTFWNVFGETIIYVALVVLTLVFTVQYLKRFIYLAFLTMIAPLIALTYPLDKIKDGQAQAFTLWLREYVFNSLLPVIHLLIYTIFVTTADELVSKNPLYAVVCIGFMVPAERFIRKMFGFDKASTVNPMGAAAGGAMIMNAVNKLGNAGPKAEAKQENKPIRTTGTGGTVWNSQLSNDQSNSQNPQQTRVQRQNPQQTETNTNSTDNQTYYTSTSPETSYTTYNTTLPRNGRQQTRRQQPPVFPSYNQQQPETTDYYDTPVEESRQRFRNTGEYDENDNWVPNQPQTQTPDYAITPAEESRQEYSDIGEYDENGNWVPNPTQTPSYEYNTNEYGYRYEQTETPNIGQDEQQMQDQQIVEQYNANSQGLFSGQNINMDVSEPEPKGFRAALREARRDRFTKAKIKNFGKKAGKKVVKGFAKGFGIATLGTIGLAAGVATGDPKNALTYGIAGATAGSKLTGRVAERGMNEATRTGTAFKKGYLGGTEYKTRKTIEELKQDTDFDSACRAAGIKKEEDKETIARQFMQNGVTDKEEIVKAMMARKAYDEEKGYKHEKDKKTGKTVVKDKKGKIVKNYKLNDKTLIDIAKSQQSISNYSYGDEEWRGRWKQRLINKGVSREDANMAEFVINVMRS